MLQNAREITRRTSGRSRLVLLLAQASFTRPLFAAACRLLLGRFTSDGRIAFEYFINGIRRRAFLRVAHLQADLYSALELAVRDLYRLGDLPEPRFIIDGGGNTGMFTLAAAARWPHAELKICEPVPHNLAILAEHLRINSIKGELLPIALGRSPGKARFYCRGATQGSFSPDLPYESVIDVPVATLSQVYEPHAACPSLVKLDIEGAEVEVLDEFLERPRQQIAIIGELHLRQVYKPHVMDLLQRKGWSSIFFEESENYSQFHFFSPDYARKGFPRFEQLNTRCRSSDLRTPNAQLDHQ